VAFLTYKPICFVRLIRVWSRFSRLRPLTVRTEPFWNRRHENRRVVNLRTAEASQFGRGQELDAFNVFN
jgi:hypothetical protein